MPSVSAAQAKLIAALAHGWKPKGKGAPRMSVETAREWHAADKKLGRIGSGNVRKK